MNLRQGLYTKRVGEARPTGARAGTAGYEDVLCDAVYYGVYKERGWLLDSAEVESAHRSTLQARLKIAGVC